MGELLGWILSFCWPKSQESRNFRSQHLPTSPTRQLGGGFIFNTQGPPPKDPGLAVTFESSSNPFSLQVFANHTCSRTEPALSMGEKGLTLGLDTIQPVF